MTDENNNQNNELPKLKPGDVIEIAGRYFEVFDTHADYDHLYRCVSIDGTEMTLIDWLSEHEWGARIVEGTPTIAQLLEAANPHTQTALNTLRDVVPGEYRSVTGMVDYARKAIEERDASKAQNQKLINEMESRREQLGFPESRLITSGRVVGQITSILDRTIERDREFDRLHEALGGIDEYAEVVDQAIEAIEERDAVRHAVSDVADQGRSLPEKVQSIKDTWRAFKETISDCHGMLDDAGFEPVPLYERVKSVLERLDKPPCDVSSLESFDKIIDMIQEHYTELDLAVIPTITARNITKYVGNVVARCTNMEKQFDRLREHLTDCDGYIELMDQAIAAIEFKRNSTDKYIRHCDTIKEQDARWNTVCALLGINWQHGSVTNIEDVIEQWAERNPESAYQQGRADAYRDIAKGGE